MLIPPIASGQTCLSRPLLVSTVPNTGRNLSNTTVYRGLDEDDYEGYITHILYLSHTLFSYTTVGDADLTGHPMYGSFKRDLPARSIQERCGINMTFPGVTEYKKRYSQSLDTPNKDYLINPSPNFGYIGRPMGIYEPVASFTEYQNRFEWPDGTRIVKLPWLRQ